MSEPPTSPYAAIGKMLMDAREELRMSTLQAAHALHIRASYLDALEAGRFDLLPGLAYTKGYLQSYAAFLQLDKDEILRQFERMEAELRRGFFLPDSLSREKTPSAEMVWGGLAVAAVIYGLWLLFTASWSDGPSVVDAIPQQRFAKTDYFHNPACFRQQAILYPPCYELEAARELPKRQVTSIMDLAITQE